MIQLNKNIIDEVLNHICNLRLMSGAVERLALVIMDKEAVKEISQRYPFIPILIFDSHLLQVSTKPAIVTCFIYDDIENRIECLYIRYYGNL